MRKPEGATNFSNPCQLLFLTPANFFLAPVTYIPHIRRPNADEASGVPRRKLGEGLVKCGVCKYRELRLFKQFLGCVTVGGAGTQPGRCKTATLHKFAASEMSDDQFYQAA